MPGPASASTVAKLQCASLKQLAWAYGCAKKHSDEESTLLRMLVAKVREVLELRGEVLP